VDLQIAQHRPSSELKLIYDSWRRPALHDFHGVLYRLDTDVAAAKSLQP
jgi:hypothetical protein